MSSSTLKELEKAKPSATNYLFDEKLLNSGTTLMLSEGEMARNYERQRFQTVNLALLVTGGALTLAHSNSVSADLKNSLPFALILLGMAGFFICHRLTQAHGFHYKLYLKGRNILIKSHPKLTEKLDEVRSQYHIDTRGWRLISHDLMWELVALLAPWSAAAYLTQPIWLTHLTSYF